MSLSITDFKEQLKGGGARPNLFRVILTFPAGVPGVDIENASFMVKAASLPASNMGETIVNFRGRQLPLPGDRTFEPWQITVLNDTDFAVRDALLAWQNLVNDRESNASTADPSGWYADLQVQQLGKDESVLKTITINGAWPQEVGQIELSNDTENTVEEFTTTFRYLYWV